MQYIAVYTFQHEGDARPQQRTWGYCRAHAASWANNRGVPLPDITPPEPLPRATPLRQPTEGTLFERLLNPFRQVVEEWRRSRGRPTPRPIHGPRPRLDAHQQQDDWDISAALRAQSQDDSPERRRRGARAAGAPDEMARHGWRKLDAE